MEQALTNNEKHRFSVNFLKNVNDELCALHEKRYVTLRDIYDSLGLIGSYYFAEEMLDQIVYPENERRTNEILHFGNDGILQFEVDIENKEDK